MGLLYIYIDDLYSPILVTPLNLAATLRLDGGRAYVGFTAATGASHWQAHDLLSWQFKSLCLDTDYTPPLVVNGEGAHECVNKAACVHPADYDHFLRTDALYGQADVGVEGW
jgi:hypothetical protein